MQGSLMGSMREFYDRGGFDRPGSSQAYGKTWYVDTINGANGNSGVGAGLGGAFLTMAKAFTKVNSGDEIVFSGVVREQLTAPIGKYDITIRGGANTPRQATDSGTPTGGGATWLAPASGATAATPLLKLLNQGWTLKNFFMSGPSDASCVWCDRRETAAVPDSSHARFENMVFGGGLIGIEATETAFMQIIGCRFQNFTGATAYAIKHTTGLGIATPLQWEIAGNIFRNNKNHILVPISQGRICFNDFGIVGNSITTVIACSLTGGLNNSVYENYLNRPQNTSPNATLYVGGTNDLWYQNYGTDAVIYGVPDNS